MSTVDERRRSFDQMADRYARARPTAPPALFDAIAGYVPPPADALEIGCGPGNASEPLLERGYRIHAVELGENLAAYARRRFAGLPFTVEVGRFEDAALEPASADLVVSASAFHWLDLEPGLRQVVRALRPRGGFALVWGSARRTPEDDRVDALLDPAYHAHAPEIVRRGPDRMEATVERIGEAIRAAPQLGDFEERWFPQVHVFDRERYLDVLATFSDHAVLPADRRARLFDALGAIIDRELGGQVERHTRARLQVARRR